MLRRPACALLLAAAAGNRSFVLSSGCDLPPGTPIENVEALCAAAADWTAAELDPVAEPGA